MPGLVQSKGCCQAADTRPSYIDLQRSLSFPAAQSRPLVYLGQTARRSLLRPNSVQRHKLRF
jgi:hypothetical protein